MILIRILAEIYPSMDRNTVNQNIRKLREQAGISQTPVYNHLGISRRTYSKLECDPQKGGTLLVSEHVFKIADFYGVPPEAVLLGYVPQEPDSRQLQEADIWKEKYLALSKEMTARIEALQSELEKSDEVCKAREITIKTQEEMIRFLKKKK